MIKIKIQYLDRQKNVKSGNNGNSFQEITSIIERRNFKFYQILPHCSKDSAPIYILTNI